MRTHSMPWWLTSGYTLLFLWFVATRLLAYAYGLRLEVDLLHVGGAHLMPTHLLTGPDFWSNLWRMHSQPPLYNALVWGVFRLTGLCGGSMAPVTLIFHGFGLLALFAVYGTQRELGVRKGMALTVSAAYAVSAAFLLYEFSTVYTMQTMALLACFAWLTASALNRHAKGDSRWPWHLAGGFLFLSLAMLYHASIHLVFGVAVVAVLMLSRLPRKTLLVCALPLLLTVGWYAKNEVMYGVFGTSSWMPFNLLRVMEAGFSPEEVQKTRALPFLSTNGLPALNDVARARMAVGSTGYEVLDMPLRDDGTLNFHQKAIVPLADVGQDIFLRLLRDYPGAYLRGAQAGMFLYMQPSIDWLGTVSQNRFRAYRYGQAWNIATSGRLTEIPVPFPAAASQGLQMRRTTLDTWFTRTPPEWVPWLAPLYLLAMLGWLGWRASAAGPGRPAWAVLLLSALYLVASGTMLDVGENARFSFSLGFLYAVALGDALSLGAGWVTRRHDRRPQLPAPRHRRRRP